MLSCKIENQSGASSLCQDWFFRSLRNIHKLKLEFSKMNWRAALVEDDFNSNFNTFFNLLVELLSFVFHWSHIKIKILLISHGC